MQTFNLLLTFCFFVFSGASLYNLYDEDDEESSGTVPQETIQENNVTMNKMKLLRSKMQSLHMSKKVDKSQSQSSTTAWGGQSKRGTGVHVHFLSD